MRSDVRKIAYISRRALALLLTLAMVLAIVPPIDIFAAAQDDSEQIVFDATPPQAATQSEAAKPAGPYYRKPIVINATTMTGFGTRDGRYNILIKGEPYSVTVQELKNVDITFDNVTINRAQTGQSAPIEEGSAAAFWQASEDLATVDRGWTTGQHYVPTCPFWITDGAEVVASFVGNNVFKAGSNMWYIANNNTATTIVRDATGTKNSFGNSIYHGYAGIQISGDSALTIQSGNVEAWGAHHTSAVTTKEIAATTYSKVFDNDDNDLKPPEISTDPWAGNDAAGGAGIGGGTSYKFNTNLQQAQNYTLGTPGSLTINSGNIVAVGGFKSAGIGGAVNGAMTTGTITINGDPATTVNNRTNVTAIGSYYAAGIGEGDSVPGANGSRDFLKAYSIVINGGVVNARGGGKASGIGTTDEITEGSTYSEPVSAGGFSGLTITLNGGDITAISGEADEDSAAAAIGAGQGTNMQPYSISIAEGTIVKATSFSKYAISNCGTDRNEAPQTVVDPNTYMYLAYYDPDDEIVSTDERIFSLYEIERTELGHFMLVTYVEDDPIYFGYIESSDPSVGAQLYLVDQNGKLINDEKNKVDRYYVHPVMNNNGTITGYKAVGQDPEGNQHDLSEKDSALAALLTQLKEENHVSYHTAANPMKQFVVPANYTAASMTLYPPEVFGGRYIFHIPKKGVNDVENQMDKDIYAVIEKMSSGESSGLITPDYDPHFTMGDPLSPNPTPSVQPDKTSAELTDLVVTSGTNGVNKHLGLEGAEQTFAPGTKSYTVWLPVGTTEFTMASHWSVAAGVSYDVTVRRDDGAKTGVPRGTAVSYDIIVGETVTLWIEKKDSNAATSIVYKVVVCVKDKYEIFPSDLSQVYDGDAVSPGVDSMRGRTLSPLTVDPVAPTLTTGAATFTPNANLGNNASLINGHEFQYTYTYTTGGWFNQTTVTATATLNLTVTATINGNNNNRQLVVTTVVRGDNSRTVTTTFSRNANGTITATTTGAGNVNVGNDTNRRVEAVDTQICLTNGNERTVLWSWSTSTAQTTTGTTYAQAKSEAATEVLNTLYTATTAGTSASSTKAYNYSGTQTQTLSMSGSITAFAQDTSSSATNTVSISSNDTVTVSGSMTGITDKSSLLTGQTVTYTYESVSVDANGNVTVHKTLADAPKDAGSYRVKATIHAKEFEASGERLFTISKRPITIIGIENWRYYLDQVPQNPETTTIPITPGTGDDESKFYSGKIRLDNVVEHAAGGVDEVELIINDMFFVNSVVGDLQAGKIQIYAAIDTNKGDGANYTFANYPIGGDYNPGDPHSEDVYIFYVPGQITYEVDGAMFLYGDLTSDNDVPEFLWYKYYPVIDLTDPNVNLNSYLNFAKNDDGSYVDTRVDYHSPNNVTHAEHIYVRTVNEGEQEARYAVDLTFGNMIFTYTKTIWDVNQLKYVDLSDGQSVWQNATAAESIPGLDKSLTNHDILVENRSNEDVYFNVTATIETHSVMIGYLNESDYLAQKKDTDPADWHAWLNHQPRVVAELSWKGGTPVYTGGTGKVQTGEIKVDAATKKEDAPGVTNNRARTGKQVVSITLYGVPVTSETVGKVTVSILPPAAN